MSSNSDEKLTPRTHSTAYSFITQKEVLVHLNVTLSWQECQCGKYMSSNFPIGWKHKWYLSISKQSCNEKIELRRAAGNNDTHAIFWVFIKGCDSLIFDGHSMSENYVVLFHHGNYVLNLGQYLKDCIGPIDLTIRILLNKDFAYLEKRRHLCTGHIFKEQFTNGLSTDVTLIANDGQSTCAHWGFLAARSEVFSTMHSQEFKESKTNKINLDLDFDTLKTFLQFIYTGQVHFDSVEIAKSLFKAGHCYLMDELKFAAEDFLSESLNVDNAIDLLILADKYSAPFLGEHAMATLKLKTFEPSSETSCD